MLSPLRQDIAIFALLTYWIVFLVASVLELHTVEGDDDLQLELE
jgi:hypothetical protein